jgi:hypothetical protein
MLHGALSQQIEVRAEEDGSRTIAGRFPYNSTATVSDGGRKGRPRKERFAPKAFEYRVEDPDAEIHLLVGHDFDRPLASKLSDTLKLEDTEEALSFEANILPAVAETQHAKDALALIASGLSVGLSPGFRLPPERAVEDAEKVEREPDKGEGSNERGAIIRTVKAALLFELSIVTRPAFEEAEVQARNWSPVVAVPRTRPAVWRWR